jgi:uncharacterized repeat protein (TIGR01451 family)
MFRQKHSWRRQGTFRSLPIVICAIVLVGEPISGPFARFAAGAVPAGYYSSKVAGTVPIARARMSEAISVKAAGRGNPHISLADGHELVTAYVGPENLVSELERNQARPLSLATADFDEDGVPDLVSAYAAANGGGIVTLHRGNVDSIYPNAPEAKRRRAAGQFTDAPFLSPALVFSVPEPPDFVEAGNFFNDGHWDVVSAARGSDALYLLPGDGQGGFDTARRFPLPGKVTAMAAGEINRRDGLTDLIVGVSGASGPKVLVFEGPDGALRHEPEVIDLPAEATSLALGQLDDDYPIDLAVAAGNHLLVVHGRDRKLSLEETAQSKVKSAVVEDRVFSSAIKSIVVGDFLGKRPYTISDIAMLTEDGNVEILSTDPEASAGKSLRASTKSPSKLADWQERSMFNLSAKAGQQISISATTQATLVRARISSHAVDNLVILDPGNRQLHIVDVAAGLDSGKPQGDSVREAALDADGEPIAVLTMRLNSDALSDLVVLRSGQTEAAFTLTEPQSTLAVTNTNDSGDGSLRQAILDATASPGANAITFNIPGSGVQTIQPLSGFPALPAGVMLDATTQPGFAGTPVIEIDGTNAAADAFDVPGGNTSIRGLAINRFVGQPSGGGSGIALSSEGSDIIEGNFVGTDPSGNFAFGNSDCLAITSSANNTIGGTVAAARDVLSASTTGLAEISMNTTGTVGNLIEGNFIGTNADGTAALSNTAIGMVLFNGTVSSNTVGGMTAGARNVISGNSIGGLFLPNNASGGNLIQGNFIGTDAAGDRSIPNGNLQGVALGSPGNTLGGTGVGGGNTISGNNEPGVVLTDGATANLVQGNFIGGGIGKPTTMAATHLPEGSSASANLAIANTVSTAQVASGTRLSYTITVSNSGPDSAAGVAVQESTPDGTTFASINSAQGSSTTPVVGGVGAILCSLGTIPSGASSTITLVVNVVAPAGVTLTNTATLSTTSINPNPATFATATTVVQGGGFVGLSWQQPSSSAGNPTPAPDSLQAQPGTAAGFAPGNSGGGVYIGLLADGDTRGASGNTIGGTVAGAGNVIADNGAPGVIVQVGTGNAIMGNSIANNAGLGIDLGGTGVVLPNHQGGPIDSDPNGNENYPVLTAASGSTVKGTMNSAANSTYRVEFFSNPFCDPSGHGQGATFVGFAPVTTDANGNASFTFTSTVPLGPVVTATATDPNGNTSEFSECISVKQQSADISVRRARAWDSTGEDGTVSYSVTVTNDRDGPAHNFTLSEPLPRDTVFRAVTAPPGWAVLAPPAGGRGSIVCTRSSLDRGGSSTFEFVVSPDSAGTSNDALSGTPYSRSSRIPDASIDSSAAPCVVVQFNIYISTSQPVQTVPANLWETVPASTQNSSAPSGPAGSFYVVTTVWNCNGMLIESGGSNQVNVPGGPTLGAVTLTNKKIKIAGTGFVAPVQVFINGVGFKNGAGGSAKKVVQKGPLTNGGTIVSALPSGKAVNLSVMNSNGGISSVLFTH